MESCTRRLDLHFPENDFLCEAVVASLDLLGGYQNLNDFLQVRTGQVVVVYC